MLGAPLYTTASREFSTRHRYDAARRPTHTFVTRPDGTTFTATRIVYGEAAATPAANNLRGQAHRIYDGAGLQEHEEFDVDGNLVRQSRRLAAAYDITPDWAALDELEDPAAMDTATAGSLEAETFTTEASFDAMGRPVTQTTPDASVLHLGYGDAGHLETVAANVRSDVTQTSFVSDLRYNARGQRTLVVYGNGTQTSYAYDPLTFRLTQLQTERTTDGHLHQDLRYTFDPAGNITEIRDLAQPIVFTNNAAVSADQRFEYDALYRLVHAEGREHGSQGQPVAEDFISRASPDDPTGLRPYTEQYLYDAVGNILQLQHAATGGNWTRHYSYDPVTSGNRLLANSAPGDAPGVYSHTYAHDAHGSMTAMPHLASIGWDWADRMQSADLGGGGTVHFTYDAAGNRVRKLRVNQAGTSTYERIYLGGFELYREHVGTELRLERQTLHVGDDAGRVCLVETKTIDNALPIASAANISRYQYANHLGTVGLELDETGQLISYEEFHPYGTTAYRAANSAVDVSPSRYRYTGKERDEETGLAYHGARYYASWLARWTAADPIGLGDGPNRFAYVSGNPVGLRDPSGALGEPSEQEQVAARQKARAGESAQLYGPSPAAVEPSPEERAAASRTERRAARRAAREAEILGATVDMAVAQYESQLRMEDAHRVEQLEKIAQTLGFHPTGRVVSHFEPGGEGPRRVDQFRSDLNRALMQTNGRPFEERVAALSRVNKKALAGIDWRVDAAMDAALFEVATSFGAAVAGRGQGATPTVRSRSGPLAGATDAEIAAAVNAPGSSELLLQAPAPVAGKYTHSGGTMMIDQVTVMSKSSATGATGNVQTKIRVHTADPGTAHPTGNSATGNTLNITQGSGGKRRMLPDGTWVHQSTATDAQWNAAHIPIHRR